MHSGGTHPPGAARRSQGGRSGNTSVMRRPPEPRPPEGPQALLDHYDTELRPAMLRIRRAREAYAFMYAFTIAVNAMGRIDRPRVVEVGLPRHRGRHGIGASIPPSPDAGGSERMASLRGADQGVPATGPRPVGARSARRAPAGGTRRSRDKRGALSLGGIGSTVAGVRPSSASGRPYRWHRIRNRRRMARR